MKRIVKYFILSILFLCASILISETVEAIQLESIPIEVSKVTKHSLTNTPIELNGPYAETHFYYELYTDLENDDYYVQFEINTSELLIEPSSLTIKIDEEPIQTVPLVGNESNTVKVELEGEALDKGSHTITASFSGYIIDRVCVPQDTPGNWMTIQPHSFIALDQVGISENLTLEDYPQLYIGFEGHEVAVIIPDNPADQTLQSAHMVAHYLSNQSADHTVLVVEESEVETIKGNIVIIGGIDEFYTDWMKEITKLYRDEIQDDSLYMTQMPIKQKNTEISGLLALAKHPENILHNAEILTESTLIEQLVGESMQVSDLPDLIQQHRQYDVSFSDFGFIDFTLDRYQTKTQSYYHYLPLDKNEIKNPFIELFFKKASVLKDKFDLVIHINDVPHSVDMDSLEEDLNGNLYAKVPFDQEILSNNRLVSLQLVTNGLRIDNPCETTDYNPWLHVFSESKFVLPTAPSEDQMYYNHFPFPFSGEDELIIVKPNSAILNKDLQNLFSVLTTNSQLPPLQILSSSNVTKDILSKGNILFIGGMKEHDLLKEVEDQLIVQYNNGENPLLGQEGFIEPAINYYSFMQKSPWNKNHYLVVFDEFKEMNKYFTREFLQYLAYTENTSSIAVQNGPDSFHTNASTLETSKAEVNEISDDSNDLFIWGIVFAGLLLVIAILILVQLRKRKNSK